MANIEERHRDKAIELCIAGGIMLGRKHIELIAQALADAEDEGYERGKDFAFEWAENHPQDAADGMRP